MIICHELSTSFWEGHFLVEPAPFCKRMHDFRLKIRHCRAKAANFCPELPNLRYFVTVEFCWDRRCTLPCQHTSLPALVHMDLKPDSLLIANGVIKLAGLGFCRELPAGGQVGPLRCGSSVYMVPPHPTPQPTHPHPRPTFPLNQASPRLVNASMPPKDGCDAAAERVSPQDNLFKFLQFSASVCRARFRCMRASASLYFPSTFFQSGVGGRACT